MSLLGTLVNALADTKDDAKTAASSAASSAAGQGESLLSGLAGLLGGGEGRGGFGNIAELAEKFHVVDILKEVGMPHDLGSIAKLADNFGFTGDKDDHHGMQSWVKEKLVAALADNGGKLPTNFLS